MQENQIDLLTDELLQHNSISRKKLLPLWIKIFAWIFLLLSAFVPTVLVLGLMGYDAQLSVYGLDANEPFSSVGIIIAIILIIKGVTAFGLLKEKGWAIKLALVDAVIGIAVCTLVMLYPIIDSNTKLSLRLELVALIPYLSKLLKIKKQWETSVRM